MAGTGWAMQPLLTCHHLYEKQHYPGVIPWPKQGGRKQADAMILYEELCNEFIPAGLRSIWLQQLKERQRQMP